MDMSDFDDAMAQARKMAQTPKGRQLAAALQQLDGTGVRQAMDAAAAGDMSQAKQLLKQLMQNPQMQQILQQLGGGNGA